jgi:hypothetical protein
VAALIVGSISASSGRGGITAADVLHAVRPADCRTLCGTPVTFVFLDAAFPTGDDSGLTLCDVCRVLAPAVIRAAA